MSTIVLLTLAVCLAGVFGYSNWMIGVSERDALQQRTVLEFVEARSQRLSNRLDVWLRNTGPGRWLNIRLIRAGVGWRLIDVAAGLTLLALLVWLLSSRFISWWFALLVTAGAVRLALTLFTRLEARRREAFVAQLPEVARVLSNATSAGLALRSAIRMASEDMAEPASLELRRLSEELDVGTPLNDALNNLQDRLPSRELSLLTRTLIIQARAGGAVVTALRGMSETLESRKDLRREIRTMISGAVFTSYVVLILGAGSLLMLNLIAPGTLHQVTSSVVGQIVLVVAIALYVAGWFAIRKVTRIDV